MNGEMSNSNIILLTDSYKVSHWRQYPPGTSNVYSYYESRGGKFDHTVFFGLQYIVEKYLTKKVTIGDIMEAKELFAQHFGSEELFNGSAWERIAKLGYLPVRIRAVPEGTRVPVSNVLMTVENTEPEFYWLTNYLETLLAEVWYPTTVATTSHETRRLLSEYLELTGDPAGVDFKLHDFGFRGVSSVESAGIGGAAHLVNFKGTDTVAALRLLRDYYGADEVAGYSVPAAEHSTITSWGRHGEVDAFRNMIEQYGNQPFYSVVSDSYDIYQATRSYWGGKLREQVLAAPGTLVVRPDSGDPHVVVSKLLNILGETFGYEVNEKGYRVLNPKVRIIQGDGMSYETIEQTLSAMVEHGGWSADNVVFGMGGGLLQKLDRDTQRFAFKCSSVVVNGHRREVYKDPVGDKGKMSKRGRLVLARNDEGEFVTMPEKGNEKDDELVTVFENGVVKTRYSLDQVRENAGTAAPALV